MVKLASMRLWLLVYETEAQCGDPFRERPTPIMGILNKSDYIDIEGVNDERR